MRLGELISQLEQLRMEHGPDLLVVQSVDGEGNSIRLTYGLEVNIYVPDSSWDGELHPLELTDEMREHGWSDEDMAPEGEGEKCVSIWPAN